MGYIILPSGNEETSNLTFLPAIIQLGVTKGWSLGERGHMVVYITENKRVLAFMSERSQVWNPNSENFPRS